MFYGWPSIFAALALPIIRVVPEFEAEAHSRRARSTRRGTRRDKTEARGEGGGGRGRFSL